MPEWLLTDEESEQVSKLVKSGVFIWRGMVCPDYEMAHHIAQAKKLVEWLEKHSEEIYVFHDHYQLMKYREWQGLRKEVLED